MRVPQSFRVDIVHRGRRIIWSAVFLVGPYVHIEDPLPLGEPDGIKADSVSSIVQSMVHAIERLSPCLAVRRTVLEIRIIRSATARGASRFRRSYRRCRGIE